MLTAAIVTNDAVGSAQLLAGLQQTGLVSSVKQWMIPAEKMPEAGELTADIVLLDLSRDPEPFFAFSSHIRRLRPSVRLIACSATTPPSPQLLLDAMRSGVQDFVSKPVVPDTLKEILSRLNQEGQSANGRPADKLIALMGSKGGVGTTTVAVNLGVQLSAHSRKQVVLLDFARPLGNVHLLLDLHPRFGVRDAIENLDRLDSHFLSGMLERHKTKLEILGGALQLEEWQNIPVAPLDRVVNVAQTGFDVVLADLGSYFSSDLGHLLKSARMILIVVEVDVPSLWALQRRLLALGGLGVDPDRIRVIVNRWHKGDEDALKSIEKDMKRPPLACLPNDFRKASGAVNLGSPLTDNDNPLTVEYRQLADHLTGNGKAGAVKRTGLTNFFSLTAKR
ncbi:MAG: cellulose synthase operon protein YhjQ/BcsQ [Candidatus Acidiferrales bacterium]|jgi:pilus assembly protein CpaE